MITSLVSFGHCIVCRSLYRVWLPLWYLLAIVLSVGRFTVFDYPFGIFWPLYCLSVVLRCMITSFVSFGHCIVCLSFYGVWLPLWYLLYIVLSVGRFTVYDYPFGIFWPLYCLSVVLRCMITPLVSFAHCIVCPSFYGVWLPLWYCFAIVLSVGRFTVYDYSFGMFWPLYCLSVVLRCVITHLVSFGHCIVCRSFYGVWLPLWYLLAIVLSVGRFTVYDYPFGIFWPLYCLSVVLRCMITPLVSFGHCIVCRSFYGVWLPLWYLLATVLYVGRFTVYDYAFGIFWTLYCLSVVLRCMITPLVSFGHCIVCRSFYGVWLRLWYLLAIVLSVGRFTVYDYPFGIFWLFYGVWLPLWYLLAIVLSVGRFTVYDYPFGIFWPLYCLSVVLRCMITSLVSFGNCIVCRSFYGVWLPLWYLLAIVLSVGRFTVYDYPFGIFWPLYCLSVVLQCMITPLVSFGHCIVCRLFYGIWLPLWYLLAIVLSVGRFTVYDYRFGISWPLYCLSVVLRCMITPLVSFGHCIVCRSFYGVWSPLWYLLAIVLSVGRFAVYDYPFGIVWPLYCLSVVLRCMITPLVSFGHCIVCRSFYGVWLPLWYLLATVLSVCRFMMYDYPFSIFWPLYCLSVVLRCMTTPLVSFGHCIVCRSFYGVWLPLWYLLAIVLSVGRFTVYDYLFGIFWPLYCLSVVLRCMITPLVSFGHCIVCRSFYGVWLPLWYRLALVLSVGHFTVYDYPFGIFWPLYCLSVVLRCMITPLVSFGHCIVCPSFYGVWLPLWYLLATVLSVGCFTVYDYPFGIFWPLYSLSVVLRCMITPLGSFGHCIVCRLFYGVWLPLWYILATV